MTRRTILSMIAAMFAITFTLFTGVDAKAQCPVDCTFQVDVDCALPPWCFPFKLTTAWVDVNGVGAVKSDPIGGCGTFFFLQPAPCPPIWKNKWASLDGGATVAVPNGPPVKYMLPTGCPVCLVVAISPTGCVMMKIYTC